MKTYQYIITAVALTATAALRGSGFVTYGTDTANHNGTPLPTRPVYLQSYIDPDFHTTVTRISDSTTATDGSTNFSNGVYWGNTVRNQYTKIQPWNADMSRILINNENRAAAPGSTSLGGTVPAMLLLDGNTYAFISGLSFTPWDYRWHPTDPDVLFFTYQNSLRKWSVSSGTVTVIHTFSQYSATNGAVQIGYGEGNLSADGKYVALVHKLADGTTDVIVYDTTIAGDGTVSTSNFPATKNGYAGPDWVSMSPSGTYVVVQWDDAFSEVYNRSLVLQQNVTTSGISHYDIKLEAGVDYAAGVHKNPGSGGYVYKCPLIGSTQTQLVSQGFAAHTSARNLNYPGWVYTKYAFNSTSYPFSNEICGIDLNSTSTNTTRRLGHLFNTQDDYYSESHPVPSPDGMRILFQSNWGDRSGTTSGRGTDTYIVDLRPLLPFNDDFEVNNFSSVWTVSSSSYVFRSSSAGHGSSYGMRMKGNSGGTINDRSHAYLTNSVSTVGFTGVTVQYDIQTVGLTSGHKIYLDWYDGTTWFLGVDSYAGTTWATRTITLPSGAAGKAGFRIELRTDATSTGEYANIDRVKVIGQ